MSNEPRCIRCGYTQADKDKYADHHLCPGHVPSKRGEKPSYAVRYVSDMVELKAERDQLAKDKAEAISVLALLRHHRLSMDDDAIPSALLSREEALLEHQEPKA